jgi:glycine betaine/choline ABC-type transport system substrate-binding protein
VIPPYDAIVLASPSLASRRPEVIEALRGLSGRIDASQMQRMNYAVDEEGQSAAAVAVGFLARD